MYIEYYSIHCLVCIVNLSETVAFILPVYYCFRKSMSSEFINAWCRVTSPTIHTLFTVLIVSVFKAGD